MIGGTPADPVWWHNGQTGGFRSFVAFDPARGLAVVVMANSALSVNDIGAHLMHPGLPFVPSHLPPRRTAIILPAEALERWWGIMRSHGTLFTFGATEDAS